LSQVRAVHASGPDVVEALVDLIVQLRRFPDLTVVSALDEREHDALAVVGQAGFQHVAELQFPVEDVATGQ
jgi:hypothetical protein